MRAYTIVNKQPVSPFFQAPLLPRPLLCHDLASPFLPTGTVRASSTLLFFIRVNLPVGHLRLQTKAKKSVRPLMDMAWRVNIARVNRLIGQPMAEASLSSPMCPLTPVSSGYFTSCRPRLFSSSTPMPARFHRGDDVKRTRRPPFAKRARHLVSSLRLLSLIASANFRGRGARYPLCGRRQIR